MKLQLTVVFGVLTLCTLPAYGESEPLQTWTEQAPAASPRTAVLDDANLLALLLEQELQVDSSIRVEVTQDDLQAPLAPGERKVRVGVTKPVDARVEFSNLRPRHLKATPRALDHGAIRGDGKGGFLWTGVVESSGAAALRLRFVGFFLPRNGELYLYSDEGDVCFLITYVC